ncbi:MAG: carboxypeptidase regulatory-like domain-containing protein [Acidobacteriota bacterium]|nr:carboxypeptidase regulatory-like domain-containing protein [Acidobacteriota bacterium]
MANRLKLCFIAILITTAHLSPVAQGVTGRIKVTVSASTGDVDALSTPLPGARLTLVNRALPSQSIKAVTDDIGNFAFTDLPAATYILTVESPGFPSITREISLTLGAALTVEVMLTSTISESVTVREEEGLLSTAETTTSNIVRVQALKNLPLRAENYQSALQLTPGIVRDRNGLDHIKGTRAGQSAYTINGADITDPLTGNLAFDIPLEAVASVQIEENPYSTEFGRLTGGATSLETKGGSDNFKFTLARFFPTFRNVISGPIDSFRPRLTLSGPLVRDRLYFLQSFEYRFSRIRVPSLEASRDDSTSEAFNSFTQFDLTVNKKNRIKFVAAYFPQKARFAGLNTFNPQETTPNTKQRGNLFSISEQAIFNDASFLASVVSYKTFDVDVFAQGPQPFELLPDGNTGNYFADTRRRSRRFQWQETYYARPFALSGQHSFKFGAEFNRTNVSGRYRYQPLLIRRGDNTLVQRVDFDGDSKVARAINEFAAFVQERWVVNQKLTIDGGLRFDRDGIVRQSNIAPRLAFLYLPLKNEHTIIRGGIGLFYDRTPISVGIFEPRNEGDERLLPGSQERFTYLPERIVTTFAPDGLSITDGPRRFRNDIEEPLSNPRSVRWSLQLDRGIIENLTARIGYLERRTTKDFIIEPREDAGGTGTLVLRSRGRSIYRELQLLTAYTKPRIGSWNASYVFSSARGDLNTADNFLGDFPAFVVRRNEYAPLEFDAPHRFLIYGELKTRYDITVSPSLEVRSGFPFSFVNERLDFIGARNKAGRFPTFVSLDAQVIKSFAIPRFVPRLEGRRARIGIAVFNITNHFNPRDVQSNVGSLRAGQFFNSLSTSVRGKFEFDF